MTAVNNNASPMDGAPVIDFDKFKPTRSFTAARKRKDLAMRVLIALAFIVALIPLFSWDKIPRTDLRLPAEIFPEGAFA